jgi:hypothetical protein
MSNMRSVFPKRKSRRVAAWIYVVLNPVIELVQRELDLLDRRNLTWRFTSGRCEFVRVIQEYVDSTQWPNYYDFLSEHAVFVDGFKQHDNLVEQINASAAQIYEWLVSHDDFSETVKKLAAQYNDQPMSRTFPGASVSSEAELVKYCAEYLINNLRELPSHYSLSGFWNSSNTPLLLFRNTPRFKPLERASENFLLHSGKLKRALESRRLSLSREFDVPAAPVPGIKFDD